MHLLKRYIDLVKASNQSPWRRRPGRPSIRPRSVLLVLALLLSSILVSVIHVPSAHAVVPTVLQEKYVLPMAESSSLTVTLDKQVARQNVLIVAVASSASVSDGVLPNDVTISDTLGTAWLRPSDLGTSIQDTDNQIAVQIFVGEPGRNGFATITISGYSVELVHVVEVVGARVTDDMVINTGTLDASLTNIKSFGTFLDSDITGGAFAIIIAQGNGSTSAAVPDPLNSSNFRLAPYTGRRQAFVATPRPLQRTVDRGQTARITAKPLTTMWGGSEMLTTLLRPYMVIDADIAGGGLVFATLAIDPPASRSRLQPGPARSTVTRGLPSTGKVDAVLDTGLTIDNVTYQWLENAPSAGSYTPAVDFAAPATLTPSFVTTDSTALGVYSFVLQVTDLNAATMMNSLPVTVTVNPRLVAGPISPLGAAIDNGQSVTLTAHPSGGTPPYSYQWSWSISPSFGADATLLGTSSTQTVVPDSNTFYYYTVGDASQGEPPAKASSPPALLRVNAPFIVISEQSGDIAGPPGWSNVNVKGYRFLPGVNVVLYWQDLNNSLDPTTDPPRGVNLIPGNSIVTLGSGHAPISWYPVPISIPANASWGNGYIVALIRDFSGIWREVDRKPFNVRAKYEISSTTSDGVTLVARVAFTGNPSPDGSSSTPTATPNIVVYGWNER